DNLVKQMERFSPTICLGESVTELEKQEDGTFKLSTDKQEHFTRAIIITAGNGAFQARKLDLEGAEKYEGKNLHYFVPDMQKFKDKRVLLCGGGDSAVDWALMLEPIAKEVILVHRRDKFRAHEHSVEQLFNSDVIVKTPFVPAELIGDDLIKAVRLNEVKGDGQELIEVDDVIVNFGFVSSLGPIKNWGLTIEKNNIVVNSKMETNIPGIYAAGDICTYDGKVKLIASGFGEAPTAVNNAKTFIDPSARVQPMHSTSMFE
ncbi:MAG TPA: NAD(P)/FAD-dependent oxidoreductase, partial [Chondromyces sp.]|nr:NAD(P)/FAD-dependent oxidoreductase [Chondromyces sp.]